MSFLNTLLGFLKQLILFILIAAIVIPLLYGSTNRQYLQLRLLHSILSLKHSLIPDPSRPTLSANYRAFENILRMKPIVELDPTADSITMTKKLRSIVTFRDPVPKPSQCQINKEIFEYDGHSVDTNWVNYPARKFNKNSDKLLIYLHGGGYILGDIDSYAGFECHLSELFNVTILHVEYRLSPEHTFPSCVDDVVAVYRALLEQNISPSQLLIMGDSAGGGLSSLTIQTLLARQLSVPRGVILLSPWVDLSTSGESHTRNGETDVMLSNELIKWMARQSLVPTHSQLSADNPMFSPLFGSFEGFPPIYITVGTAEILQDDSTRLMKKAQEAGVDVTFEEGLHLLHIYPVFFPYYPEAGNTLDHIKKWIETLFTKERNQ